MTTISDKDRAEAQAIAEVLHGRGVISALSDSGVRRWLTVRDHVLAAHECPTVPVWRPVSRDEIQPGWEIRSQFYDGRQAKWGTAHHRVDGDWYTETGAVLTWDDMNWTYETTAPLPEPEPDPRVAVVLEWAADQGDDINAESLLARLDNLKAVEYSEPHAN